MRKISVKNLNVPELVHIVNALKKEYNFLVDKKLYDFFKSKAEVISKEGKMMSFITWYGDPNYPIKTWIEFKPFCDEFYLIESITVDRNLIYGYSQWKESTSEQFVISMA